MADGGSGYHPDRLALGKKPRDIFRPDCIFRTAPDVFRRPATRRLRDTGFWGWALRHWLVLVGNRQQPVELARVEASQAESEVRSVEFLESRSSSQSAQVTERSPSSGKL